MSNPTTRVATGHRRWAVITKSDTVDIASGITNAVYSDSAQDLVIHGADDTPGTFTFAAGEIKPLGAKRVLSTGSGVGEAIGLY